MDTQISTNIDRIMFVNILVLLIILAYTDALHTRMTQGFPSFVLNASETNPSLVDYKRDGVHFSIHWSAHETPYDVIKTRHDFGIKPNEEVSTIDSSNLVKGTYIFQLYTSNYMDGSVTTSYHTVTIIDEIKSSTSSEQTRHFGERDVRILCRYFIAFIYAHVRTLYDIVRVMIVASQYIGDRNSTYDEMVSHGSIVLWDIVDLNTSHYTMLATLPNTKETMIQFQRQHTLADYFSRNNVPYLEYATHFIELLRK